MSFGIELSILGCVLCLTSSPFSIVAAGVLGGWASLVLLLRPFRLGPRMGRMWGIPQFGIKDFFPLLLMLVWPLMMARLGTENVGPVRAAVVFGLLAVCVGFVWLRGLWILERLEIRAFAKRTLFLAVLIPAAVLFAFVVGHGLFSTFVHLTFSGLTAGVAGMMLVYAIVAIAIGGPVYWGLEFVFGREEIDDAITSTPKAHASSTDPNRSQ